MDVSIIIINYNTCELVIQCIKSIYEQTRDISFEVIVVDNNSNDISQKKIPLVFPNIQFIANKDNIGFGRANNRGAELATGKYLFLLNSDTLLLNNAIGILVSHFELNPSAGICGGNLFDIDLKPIHSFRRTLPSISWEINAILYESIEKLKYGPNIEFNYTNENMEVGYITGADLMIRRDVWDKISGFDPGFFMYYEDADLNFRVKKTKYKICSIPEARIIHLSGKSFSVRETQELMSLESRRHYFLKNHSSSYYQFVCLLANINIFTKMLAVKIRKKNDVVQFWQEKRRIWKLYTRKLHEQKSKSNY
jgi:GT2 family glycosyltransferase